MGYLQSEIEKLKEEENSEFFNFILKYDKPLPVVFNEIFIRCPKKLEIPAYMVKKCLDKHEENLVLHSRYEHFKKEGESFVECDNKLIKELMEDSKLPIFEG